MAANGKPRRLAATVGANIRAARDAMGITQHDLAVLVGTSDSMAVSRWERGVHRPSDENLIAVAEALGQDPAWFYVDHDQVAA